MRPLSAAAPIVTVLLIARLLHRKYSRTLTPAAFPPAATPVALALLSTRSPVNTHAPSLGFSSRHRLLPFRLPLQRPQTALLSTRSPVNTRAPSLGFSSRRRQPAFLPAAAPVANRSLIYVLTCHNTHTESRFLFTPSRRFPLPSRAHNFHPENTLACRPMRPFPPAATPVALALLSTRSPVNTHAPSLGFSSRHRLLPFRLPLQRPQTALLSTRSPVNTRAPSLGFSSRRRQPAFLPAAMPVALALLSMSSPVTTCADSRFLFTPLRRLKLPSRTHGFYTANTLSRRRPLPFRLPLHRL